MQIEVTFTQTWEIEEECLEPGANMANRIRNTMLKAIQREMDYLFARRIKPTGTEYKFKEIVGGD